MSSPLTLAYYDQFLAALFARGNVELINYNDLKWGDDRDYKNKYAHEFASWKDALKDGTVDDTKAYVLLQHDTDSGPVDSVIMGRLEEKRGAFSSIMTFARWNREKSAGSEVDYPIDWDALRDFESKGFCIGYHCNAMHLAQFDEAEACKIFDRDSAILREKFNLKFFSPHGGYKGPGGEANNSVHYPDLCKTDLRWVHNRYSPVFTGRYSDGGLVKRLLSGEAKDLRAWLRDLKPGTRARALLHPQYYRENEFEPFEPGNETLPAWYREFCELMKTHDEVTAAEIFWSRPSTE